MSTQLRPSGGTVPLLPNPADAARGTRPVAVLPFDLVNDHIMLRAAVGGEPATLILDTGSSVSSLGVEWAARLDAGRLRHHEGDVRVAGAAEVSVTLATVDEIRVGDVALRDQRVVLLPLGDVSRAEGREVAGVLGFELLSRFVVEIDYGRREVRLLEPERYEYRGGGFVVPVSLEYRVPVVEARIMVSAPEASYDASRDDPSTLDASSGGATDAAGDVLTARLILDLGSSRLALRLSAAFAEAHPEVLAHLDAEEASIGTGVGGALMGRVGRLHELRLGDFAYAFPSVGVARDRVGALALFSGSVGVPVFRRTTLVDYSRSRVIFESPSSAEGVERTRGTAGDAMPVTAPAA